MRPQRQRVTFGWMILKPMVLSAAILTCGCTAPIDDPNRQENATELKVASGAGLSLTYSTNDFVEAGIRKEQKRSAEGLGNVVDEGFAPEHFCLYFEDTDHPLPPLEQGPRYFFPAHCFVCAIPLSDSSVEDFGAAYPTLSFAAVDLRKILRERPEDLEQWRDVPDVPANNAGPSIFSRFQYLDFRSGSGIAFLTQYSQEMEPNPVNNEELILSFQGLTDDGMYYLAGRLAVTHPSLPKGIDFTEHIERDKSYRYLRSAEEQLEGFSDESFRPSLKSLKALLSSIHVE